MASSAGDALPRPGAPRARGPRRPRRSSSAGAHLDAGTGPNGSAPPQSKGAERRNAAAPGAAPATAPAPKDDPAHAPDAAPPPKKRPRPAGSSMKATSCENCRRRKLKCDRTYPCSGCVLRHEEHLCRWEPGCQPPRTNHEPLPPAPVLSKLERIEQMASALADKLGVDRPAAPASAAPTGQTAACNGAGASGCPGPEPRPAPAAEPPRPDPAPVHGTLTASLPPSPGFPSLRRRRSVAGSIPVVPPDKDDSGLTLPFSIRDDWKNKTSQQESLRELVEVMPPPNMLREMVRFFFSDVLLFSSIIDQGAYFARLDRFEAYRARPPAHKLDLTDSEARGYLEFSALSWAMCSIALIDRGHHTFAGVLDLFEQPILTFLDAAMQAVDTYQGIQMPTIETVRVQILLSHLFSILRGDSYGSVAYLLAIGNAFAVQLHKEPSPTLSEDVFYDRIRLFAFVIFLDAFGSRGPNHRRGCLIPDKGPYSTPRFLYSEASWTMATVDGPWPLGLKLLFEMSRVMNKANERQYMSEEDAYHLTIELQGQVDSVMSRFSPSFFEEPEGQWLPTQKMPLSVAMQLTLHHVTLVLHGRHYVAGWLDPKYATSRNMCLRAAVSFVRTFLLFTTHLISPERMAQMSQGDVRKTLKNHEKLMVTRGSFLGRKAAPCGLLLQHHLFMVSHHGDQIGGNIPGMPAEDIMAMLVQLKSTLEIVGPTMRVDKSQLAELLPNGRVNLTQAWRYSPLIDSGVSRPRRASIGAFVRGAGGSPRPHPIVTSLSSGQRGGTHSETGSPLSTSSPTWMSSGPTTNMMPTLEQDASVVAAAPWFQQTFVEFETLVSSLLGTEASFSPTASSGLWNPSPYPIPGSGSHVTTPTSTLPLDIQGSGLSPSHRVGFAAHPAHTRLSTPTGPFPGPGALGHATRPPSRSTSGAGPTPMGFES